MEGLLDLEPYSSPVASHECACVIAETCVAQGLNDLR